MVNIINRVGASLAAFAILASSAMVVTPAFATSTTHNISIPINTVVRKIGVGNSKVLAEENIENKYRGMVCDVTAHAENQSSVHPGNNIVVASGNSSVTLVDVEREPGVKTGASGELTLGNNITATLVMGQDDVFSGGMDVKIKCEKTIEVCRDGQIVTIRKSERMASDTDECVTYIEVCRDHQIITIDERDRKDTDTDTCPAQIEVCRDHEIITIFEDERRAGDTDTCPGQIQVCRDNEIVTIFEDERLATDTDVCPEVEVCRDGELISVTADKVLDTDTEECPEEEEPKVEGEQTVKLPKTGAATLVTAGLGLSTVLSGLYGFVNKRR